MKNKPSVSIGVPAFNEEANIVQLLTKLLAQQTPNYILKEIIVVTDGSTDKTPFLIRSFKNKIIVHIGESNRLGQQERQNQIINIYTGDILVILEADLLPANSLTISELIKPFTEDYGETIGMVVGKPIPIKAQGFFEQIMNEGHTFKQRVFTHWRNGINVYTAGGHSMKALSRSFTEKLHYPPHVPEDAFTFLELQKTKLKMVRNPQAIAYMRNVTHFTDRLRQCLKYQTGKKSLRKYFSKNMLDEAYNLPLSFLAFYIILEFFRQPFWFSLYIFEAIINRMFTKHKKQFNALHTTYQSSKNLSTVTINQPIATASVIKPIVNKTKVITGGKSYLQSTAITTKDPERSTI